MTYYREGTMTAVEILSIARNKIEHGWSQNAMYRDSDGCLCAREEAQSYSTLGAILSTGVEISAQGRRTFHKGLKEAYEALRTETGQNLELFENSGCRTQKDIVELFNRAIIKAGGKEH